MHDPINPSHYTSGSIECIEAIEASMSQEAFRGFLKGNCIKYLFRYEKKNGAQDLRKCKWYLERLEGIVAIEESKSTEAKVLQCLKEAEQISYDPDDYMASGCSNGFCAMPEIRQGPGEELFARV